MFFYVDNFLPNDLFESLNDRMIQRFKPNLRQDDKPRPRAAVRIRTTTDGLDYSESAVLLGKMVPDIVEYTRTFLIDNLNFKDPTAHGIWFQYMSNQQLVGPHYDNKSLRGKLPTQCFSTFLYSHAEWEDSWGGELCFHTGKVLPSRNRMVLYSREEEHWVNAINHDRENYQRMFLGISWSTDNDIQ